MALLEIPSELFRERSIPVLETERLVLRAPRLGDVKAVATLANDRRIAENTARIPHPYRVADAGDFITSANIGNDTTFLVTLRNGAVIGACGLVQLDRHPPRSATGSASNTGARATPPKPCAPPSTTPSPSSIARRSRRRPASPTRPRAECWRSAASSGPARACCASAPFRVRRRSTASGSTAACGPRSRAGARPSAARSELVSGPAGSRRAPRCTARAPFSKRVSACRMERRQPAHQAGAERAKSHEFHHATQYFVTERAPAAIDSADRREEHRVVSCRSLRRPQPRNEISGGDHDATGPVSPRNAGAFVWARAVRQTHERHIGSGLAGRISQAWPLAAPGRASFPTIQRRGTECGQTLRVLRCHCRA